MNTGHQHLRIIQRPVEPSLDMDDRLYRKPGVHHYVGAIVLSAVVFGLLFVSDAVRAWRRGR